MSQNTFYLYLAACTHRMQVLKQIEFFCNNTNLNITIAGMVNLKIPSNITGIKNTYLRIMIQRKSKYLYIFECVSCFSLFVFHLKYYGHKYILFM